MACAWFRFLWNVLLYCYCLVNASFMFVFVKVLQNKKKMKGYSLFNCSSGFWCIFWILCTSKLGFCSVLLLNCFFIFIFYNLLLNCCTERNFFFFDKWEKNIFYSQLNLIVWLCIKGYKSLLFQFQFQYQWKLKPLKYPKTGRLSWVNGPVVRSMCNFNLWPLQLFSMCCWVPHRRGTPRLCTL